MKDFAEKLRSAHSHMPKPTEPFELPDRLGALQNLVLPSLASKSSLWGLLPPADSLATDFGIPEPALEDYDYFIECVNKTLPKFVEGKWAAPEWYPSAQLAQVDELSDEDYLKYLPHISVKNPSLLAYWQTDEKFRRHIETPIKFGRFLKSKTNLSGDGVARQVCYHKLYIGEDSLQVKFAGNDDLDAWDRCYRTSAVQSCMNDPDTYETAYEYDVHRNYASSAFGLPDNGLRLAYLEVADEVVARAIVHEPTKTFVRCYGDDNLKPALLDLGYRETYSYPEGLVLYTKEIYAGHTTPYIDGNLFRAHLGRDCSANCQYWELASSGDYELDTTDGYASLRTQCEVCGERTDDCESVYWFDGHSTTRCDVCESCRSDAEDCEDSNGDDVSALREHVVSAEDSDGWTRSFTKEAADSGYKNLSYSHLLDGWIYGEDVVRLHNGDYAFTNSDGVEYLEYLDEYADSRDATFIPELGVTVLDSDTCEYELSDGSLTCVLPVRGLSQEIDELLDTYIKKCEENIKAEAE